MEDCDVMIFIIDHYGPKMNNRSTLLQYLRKDLGLSCSAERFEVIFNRYMREYAQSTH